METKKSESFCGKVFSRFFVKGEEKKRGEQQKRAALSLRTKKVEKKKHTSFSSAQEGSAKRDGEDAEEVEGDVDEVVAAASASTAAASEHASPSPLAILS